MSPLFFSVQERPGLSLIVENQDKKCIYPGAGENGGLLKTTLSIRKIGENRVNKYFEKKACTVSELR